MKILFGVPYRDHLEIALLEIEAFRSLGVDVETSDYSNSGKVKGILRSLRLVIRNAVIIERKCRMLNIDILYLNTSFDYKTVFRDFITVLVVRLRKGKIKVVLKVHGSDEMVVKAKLLLKAYLFKKVDIFLILSKEEMKNFAAAGIDPRKLIVTANPLKTNCYYPNKYFKFNQSIEDDAVVLLFVGRLIEEKGILDLIQACSILKAKGLKFRLLCLGNGPLSSKVDKLIAEMQLSEITMVGYVAEVDTNYYYANSDILILPTYHCEGFPMAVFRAVAAGKPIITTKIRGAADYLIANKNCLWVNKKDPEDLAAKIFSLSTNQLLRSSMSRNNIQLAENFTANKIVEKVFPNFYHIITNS